MMSLRRTSSASVLTAVFLSLTLPGTRPLSPAPARPAEAKPLASASAVRPSPRALDLRGRPLHFEANHGQADLAVRFLARDRGYTLFLTSTEAVIVTSPPGGHAVPLHRARTARETRPAREAPAASAVVRMKLLGANADPLVTGGNQLPGRANYFLGNDPARWRTNIPTYGHVRYREVYPGIDLVYYGRGRQLEYDLVVAPGADPRRIRIAFEGAERVDLDRRGDLVLATPAGELRLQKPQIYQEIAGRRVAVDGGFALAATPGGSPVIAFRVAAYDARRPLVIDPILAYSTFLGGGSFEEARAVAVDSAGSAYLLGRTLSSNFPLASPLQGSIAGSFDIVIAKLDASGSSLVYSTYLGGEGQEEGFGIAVDGGGNAVVVGTTLSSLFPTMNAAQSTFGGVQDAFVARLNPSGSALLFSTYLGGSNSDVALGVALDGSGDVYVAGYTASSSDFPLLNPLQPLHGGGVYDAFVTKFSAAGAKVYSTFLGCGADDFASAIAVDAAGSAYVAGQTTSATFPTLNPLQGSLAGFEDAFVSKLNAAGSALVYSTYLGGAGPGLEGSGGISAATGIAVDTSGNAYVTGLTDSDSFPTVNAFQAAFSAFEDGFVATLNAAGSALVYSTYVGGSDFDTPFGIAVDAGGNATVVGETFSTDFPGTSPVQFGPGGSQEAFVARFTSGGTLDFFAYLGGGGSDSAKAVALDGLGNAYVVGSTRSSDFPTVNAFQSTIGSTSFADIFVAKIESPTSTPPPAAPTSLAAAVVASTTVALTWIDASTDETGFEIERDGGGGFVFLASVGPGVQSFQDATVSLTRTYSYRVRAVNGAGASDYSNVPTITVPAGRLLLLPSRATFFGTGIGTTATKTITLQNTGQGTLAGSVTSGLSAPFSLVGGGSFTLAPGQTQTLTVQFEPTQRGTFRSAVSVTSDDPARPSTRILVTGIVR